VRKPEKRYIATFPHGPDVGGVEGLEHELADPRHARRGGDGLRQLLSGALPRSDVGELEPRVAMDDADELRASVPGGAHDTHAEPLGPWVKLRHAVRQSAASSGTLRRGAPVCFRDA
jgi:hypothetical protein